MEFRFEGYIREIGPLETITFNDGTIHNKCEIIVTTDEQRPNALGIVFWEEDAKTIRNAVPKQYISVDYNAKADFVKGKNGLFLKNNLKAWRFQLGQVNPNLQWAEAAIPAYQQPAQAAAPQVAAPQVAMQVNGLPNPVMLNQGQAPF